MTDIDRRTLLGAAGAAGAGMMLAGCDGRSSKKKCEETTDLAGLCASHGKSVDQARPDKAQDSDFKPQYLSVAYLRFDSLGRLIARTAHLALPQYDDAYVNAQTTKLLEEMVTGVYTLPVLFAANNFVNFHYSKQTIVVVFLDNDPNYIRFNSDPSLSEQQNLKYVIRFSQFSGQPPYSARRPNHSYFGIRKLDLVSTLLTGKTAYRLNFWSRDKDNITLNVPKTDKRRWHIYSMNIHLLMKAALATAGQAETWVPIIVDPDTGNMGSNP